MRVRPAVLALFLPLIGCGGSPSTERTAVADNPALAELYARDQDDEDRQAVRINGGGRPTAAQVASFPPGLREDYLRLVAADSIVEAGGARTANDQYHAAMIYQHGADTTSYRRAYELARRAVEIHPTHAEAKWLSAAAWDRYLDESGQPQWYGTQYRCDSETGRRLLPVVPGRVTDAERQALGVPTLAEARAREGTPCGS